MKSTLGVSRSVIASAAFGALVSTFLIGTAAAQQMAAVEWQQRFDSAPSNVEMPGTSVPLLSSETVQATQAALVKYQELEARGGWQGVPSGPALKLGSKSPNVGLLRQRLVISGDLAANVGDSNVFDSYVDAAVRRFQARHGLIVTGIVGPDTLQAMNVPVSVRVQQLQVNLARLEKLTASAQPHRYVMVNIPGAQAEAVEDGVVELHHNVVVGKADRESPELSVKILAVNFNPYWTVPASIIKKDLIPKMQAQPDYLTKNHIRIYDQHGQELQPEQIDWHSDEAMNYRFTQDPGDFNSMGSVRINMANKDGVYMHDTPSKGLFGENNRFHSSGCVRVQNVHQLVRWLLKDTPGWDSAHVDAALSSGDRIDAPLAQPVPVKWVYITGWADADGVVQFREDIYNKDGLGQLAAR